VPLAQIWWNGSQSPQFRTVRDKESENVARGLRSQESPQGLSATPIVSLTRFAESPQTLVLNLDREHVPEFETPQVPGIAICDKSFNEPEMPEPPSERRDT
jgi:hypothetical protein